MLLIYLTDLFSKLNFEAFLSLLADPLPIPSGPFAVPALAEC